MVHPSDDQLSAHPTRHPETPLFLADGTELLVTVSYVRAPRGTEVRIAARAAGSHRRSVSVPGLSPVEGRCARGAHGKGREVFVQGGAVTLRTCGRAIGADEMLEAVTARLACVFEQRHGDIVECVAWRCQRRSPSA